MEKIDLTSNSPVLGTPWPKQMDQMMQKLTHLTCQQATAYVEQFRAGKTDSANSLLLLHNSLHTHETDCVFATSTSEDLEPVLDSIIAK
jgi:hypothetical protein